MDIQKIERSFVNLFKQQMKEPSKKAFAEKCLNKIDSIVDWFVKNKREITMQDLEQIIK